MLLEVPSPDAAALVCLFTFLQAWKIFRSLDVDYVLVVFGGLVGYPSDDINKFLWMVSSCVAWASTEPLADFLLCRESLRSKQACGVANTWLLAEILCS